MQRYYRQYRGIEIEQLRTPLSIDSDYYNSMYNFKLNGNFNVTHKLRDAKARIDKSLDKANWRDLNNSRNYTRRCSLSQK